MISTFFYEVRNGSLYKISLKDPSYFGFVGDLPSDKTLNFISHLLDIYCDLQELLTSYFF